MPLENDLFASEKLCPVLTLYQYGTFSEALSILIRLTNNAGRGHSCGIHTWKQKYIQELGETVLTSRIMIRQPQAPANGGNFFNGMPSTVTLGCGTWGGEYHYRKYSLEALYQCNMGQRAYSCKQTNR